MDNVCLKVDLTISLTYIFFNFHAEKMSLIPLAEKKESLANKIDESLLLGNPKVSRAAE